MTEVTGDTLDKDLVREEIALAALKHVPFDGWTLAALNAGAKDAGYDPVTVQRVFPKGLSQWADIWSRWADDRMLESLNGMDLGAIRVRDRIAAGVRARIMVNADNREALRTCLGWLAMPLNTPVAAKNTLRTVNAIWYAAGDRSTDWNYYTKRGLLAPVYTTTVLYWLADTANEDGDYPDTWAYLDRRIQDVLTTFGLPRKLKAQLARSEFDQGLAGGPLGMLKRAFEGRMARRV